MKPRGAARPAPVAGIPPRLVGIDTPLVPLPDRLDLSTIEAATLAYSEEHVGRIGRSARRQSPPWSTGSVCG